LSTEEIRSLFQQAAKMGVKDFELTGGETYLRDDWVELIRMATELGMTCALITAGRAIDDTKARQARQAGLDRVSVSLDGLRETHESLRRTPNGFDLGLRAIAAFRNAGLDVGCNTQVNARNWRDLPPLADLLVTQGLYAWQIQLMIPMGRAADAADLWLEPYQMLEVIPAIARVIDRCAPDHLKVFAGDNVGYFGPHEGALRRYSSRRGHTIGCSAGLMVVGVDANGNVTGCSALDGAEQMAGNIRERELCTIFEEAAVLRRNVKDGEVWGFCATCYYAAVCRGGCSATAIALTGRPGNNPYCHHRALELARIGKRERLSVAGPHLDGPRGHGNFEIVVEEQAAEADACES
jgi:radical SAM protein with 4Fe4S-binding SPASM domain